MMVVDVHSITNDSAEWMPKLQICSLETPLLLFEDKRCADRSIRDDALRMADLAARLFAIGSALPPLVPWRIVPPRVATVALANRPHFGTNLLPPAAQLKREIGFFQFTACPLPVSNEYPTFTYEMLVRFFLHRNRDGPVAETKRVCSTKEAPASMTAVEKSFFPSLVLELQARLLFDSSRVSSLLKSPQPYPEFYNIEKITVKDFLMRYMDIIGGEKR